MATITPPKLPNAKLGIVNGSKRNYYYIQTYTHHYDRQTKRSIRDSQKTIGTVVGGDKYGLIEFKEDFLKEYPELENFIVYWTKNGYKFELADEDEFSLVSSKVVEKKLAGASWAIQKIMSQSCFGDALRDVFNKYNRHLKLASIIIYMILNKTNVMHNYAPFAMNTWLPWASALNDGQIHRLFSSITQDEVYKFFNALNRHYFKLYGDDFYKNIFVALDSTSISTYSSLSHSEYGHNKDGDLIPQINYLMICDEAHSLPIYGKIYKGNVVDVTTVKNLLAELNIMYSKVTNNGNSDFTPNLIFVTDRGYDSESNLQDFLKHNYSFVMRSKLQSRWVIDEVEANLDNLKDDDCFDTFTSQNMFTSKVQYKYDEYPVDGKYKSNTTTQNIHVHMYYDDNIYNSKRSVLKTNVANARDEYNKKLNELYASYETVTPKMIADIKVDCGREFVNKYCKLDDKGYAIINKDAINNKVKLAGIMVLLSDVVDEPKKAMFAYQRRQRVEHNFQIFKDYLNFNRPFASNDKAFFGKFMCQFIASAIVMLLENRIKDYESSAQATNDGIKLNNKSLSRLLAELNTIMLTIFKDGYFFDEISGKYKTLFKAIGVPEPMAKHKYESTSIKDDEDNYIEEEREYEAIGGEVI